MRRILAASLLAIVGGGALVLFVRSPRFDAMLAQVKLFTIKELVIQSEWPLTTSTVRGWLPPLEGKSLLGVNPGRLIDTLSSKPWVAGVTIKKEFPSRLRIDLTTKRAGALLIQKGQPFFIDGNGSSIDKASAQHFRSVDLPVISFEKEAQQGAWALRTVLENLAELEKALAPTHRITQLSLAESPVFRIYLTPDRIEVTFSVESWRDQLPRLIDLLETPPIPIGQIKKINLVFPKKAVVSSSLSN